MNEKKVQAKEKGATEVKFDVGKWDRFLTIQAIPQHKEKWKQVAVIDTEKMVIDVRPEEHPQFKDLYERTVPASGKVLEDALERGEALSSFLEEDFNRLQTKSSFMKWESVASAYRYLLFVISRTSCSGGLRCL